MKIYWPEHLPLPQRSGYSVQSNPSLIRTEMESGPPEVSRTSHITMREINVSVFLTDSQEKDFWHFFESASGANGGANYFSMPVKTVGNVVPHQVRIKDSPASMLVGVNSVEIKFTVETDEAHYE
ncbi:hypothetical protein [Marinibactrum halimedae]|uniref:Uncharacterized protein n=1 Tax=Marinibactrum halimedae TaxID=1444977 RepID=A0AA37TAB7_9GAMM|nr:hypothetical protein [Marinibactrum halimedae]MCD9458884.1 hypothetical protein [Marinibactrum halimedae]GLS27733.1 hypothetical protein GCM10007877_34520 [Marinibactrum halimedae]